MNHKRNWLCWYLIEKNKILDNHATAGTPQLTDMEDLLDIMEWDQKKISTAYEKIRNSLSTLVDEKDCDSSISDDAICPWCPVTRSNCRDCGYGKRHGFCGNVIKFDTGRSIVAPRYDIIIKGLRPKAIIDCLKPHAGRLLEQQKKKNGKSK